MHTVLHTDVAREKSARHLSGMWRPVRRKSKDLAPWKIHRHWPQALRRQGTVSVANLASHLCNTMQKNHSHLALLDTQYSREASITTIQSLLMTPQPQTAIYPLGSDMRRAPENFGNLAHRSASFGTEVSSAGGTVPSTLSRPMVASMIPSLPLGATMAPPGQSLVQNHQYMRTLALHRVQHQRQIIADLRASLLGPSTSINTVH
jgi:hypothetical protein